jgi:hypothetical protein
VDDHEVRFCTHLKGKGSWFLPFNQGWNDGAGNPPNPEGIKTDYLRKRGLTDILEDYAQVVEARNAKTGRKKAAQIFPRYHQLDVVRKLLADAGQQGCRLKALQVFEAREHGEPSKIATPVEGARNWSRLEVAQYCQAAIKAGEPVILGIDHAFSFPMSYMKRYEIETWDRFLDDFTPIGQPPIHTPLWTSCVRAIHAPVNPTSCAFASSGRPAPRVCFSSTCRARSRSPRTRTCRGCCG